MSLSAIQHHSIAFVIIWMLHNQSMKCPRCKSTQMSKNGHHHGKQNYVCKQCGRQFVEFCSSRGYSDDAKNICLRMRASGMSFRAIERATGISHTTVINWVRQAKTVPSNTSEPEINSEDASESMKLNELQTCMSLNLKAWLILKVSIHSLLHNLRHCKMLPSTLIML